MGLGHACGLRANRPVYTTFLNGFRVCLWGERTGKRKGVLPYVVLFPVRYARNDTRKPSKKSRTSFFVTCFMAAMMAQNHQKRGPSRRRCGVGPILANGGGESRLQGAAPRPFSGLKRRHPHTSKLRVPREIYVGPPVTHSRTAQVSSHSM